MAVQYTPEGYSTVTPYIIVRDGAAALDFYVKTFGAVELERMEMPDGRVGHAEFTLGSSRLMLASEFPELEALSPETVGGTPVSLMVYVEDVDELFGRALAAGATELQPVQDKFYGDRSGTLRDPFGHRWTISTHIEDVTPEEMERRSKAWAEQANG